MDDIIQAGLDFIGIGTDAATDAVGPEALIGFIIIGAGFLGYDILQTINDYGDTDDNALC
jgi:hypothetical protein